MNASRPGSNPPDALTMDQGFPWIASQRAHTLILGSMPGQASLRAREYYAHPRNCFWDIMAALFDIPRTLPYPQRLQRLTEYGIVLWDVVHQCERPGSLDSAIVESSVVPNDFNALFRQYPGIRTVYCNGGKAFTLYSKHILPGLMPRWKTLPLIRLPSTSPAYATLSASDKQQQWQLRLRCSGDPAD